MSRSSRGTASECRRPPCKLLDYSNGVSVCASLNKHDPGIGSYILRIESERLKERGEDQRETRNQGERGIMTANDERARSGYGPTLGGPDASDFLKVPLPKFVELTQNEANSITNQHRHIRLDKLFRRHQHQPRSPLVRPWHHMLEKTLKEGCLRA